MTEERDLYDMFDGDPPLSRALENELFVRYKTADETERAQIKDRVIKANMGFAANEARAWRARGPVHSLRRAAFRGLTYAFERYDPNMGFKFITFAVHHIHNHMRKEIADRKNVMAVPSKVRQHLDKFYSVQAKAQNATMAEIMDEMGCTGGDRVDLANFIKGPIFLDAPFGNLHNTGKAATERSVSETFGQCDPTDDPDDWCSLLDDPQQTIKTALGTLDPREQLVIVRYYGLGGSNQATLEQIGSMVGLTRERVRQIKWMAMVKLRQAIVQESQELASVTTEYRP